MEASIVSVKINTLPKYSQLKIADLCTMVQNREIFVWVWIDFL